MPEPTQPLSEDLTDICPGCGGTLIHCVGWSGEQDYEAVRCPNQCNLEELLG